MSKRDYFWAASFVVLQNTIRNGNNEKAKKSPKIVLEIKGISQHTLGAA